MKKMMKRLLPLCLALLLLCQMLVLTACKKEPATGEVAAHTVTLRTEGGMALADVEIFIYADNSLNDLVWAGKTDADGVLSFEAATCDTYVATLKGVPANYKVEESYPLTGTETVISLAAEMQTDVDMSTIVCKKGDVMFDFTITDTDGKTHTLSKLLKEKQAVVLNFWYTNCGPCRMEFPYLQEAYEKYSKDIEVLAMNPVDTDKAAIAAFKEELKLTFPVAAVEADWERIFQLQGYPTTVVIDRFGNISLIHTGMLESTAAFEEILSHYVEEDYTQDVVDDPADLIAGTTGDKLEFGGVQEFEVKVPADTQIPVDLYKVMNMILEIKSENVYVVYGGETYTPKDGVLTLPISAPDTMTAVSLMIGNSGKKEETFKANLSMPKGSMGNPYAMKAGDFKASVEAGNNQGVFYTYTAEQTGELTLTCLEATAGIRYDFTLYNLTSYVYRNWENDGSKNAEGKPVLTIAVTKGDEVQFSAAALPDEENRYPAGAFTFRAAFEQKQTTSTTVKKGTTYAITVKDNNGKAVPGVSFSVMADGASKQISTDASGVASIDLESKSYAFIMTVPKGYTASTTVCKLTADKPTTTVTLNKTVVKDVTYSVTVKDAKGKAVAGATVAIGNLFGTTDKNGKVSLTLPGGDYEAYISAPAGYAAPAPVKLTAAKPAATVELKAASADNGGSNATTGNGGNGNATGGTTKPTTGNGGSNKPAADKTYTVTVTDATGKGQSGIMVKFAKKDGSVAAMAATNASGVVTATLKADDYKVELLFSGKAKGYDKNAAALSAAKTALTVVIADGVSGNPVEIYGGSIMADPVRLGATYVELLTNATADSPNYFCFTPAATGLYEITTSNPKAVIDNWGNNPQFISRQTEYTGTNVFTINVKNLGNPNYFLGVYGADECVVLIKRVGDAVLSSADLPYTSYKGVEPTDYTLSGNAKLTYVDISKPHTAVLGDDGKYHLDSKTGPVLLVNFGGTNPGGLTPPALPLSDAAWNGNIKVTIPDRDGKGGGEHNYTDENGKLMEKVEFITYLNKYCGYTDQTTNNFVNGKADKGIYPLNKDLMYILQTCTEYLNWNTPSSPNYLFAGKTVDKNTAWMFLLCYDTNA